MSEPRQSWRTFLEGTQCCIYEPKCLRCDGEDKAADRIEELEALVDKLDPKTYSVEAWNQLPENTRRALDADDDRERYAESD